VPACIFIATALLAIRRRPALTVALVAGLAVATVPFLVGAIRDNHRMSRYQEPWQHVTDALPGRPLVLMRNAGAYLLHLDPFSQNGPDLDGRVLYAVERNARVLDLIAQILAGSHPDRVRSLALLMTSSGKLLSALPSWRVIKLAFDPPGKDAPQEDRVAFAVRNIAVINGPNFLPSDEQLRSRVEALTARSDYPQGGLRQFDAILGTGSLLRFTRRIEAPTVVIHGSKDPMVRIRNGRNLARIIKGARFVVVDGMGHDLPGPVWRPMVDALTENFALAVRRGVTGGPAPG